MSIIYKHCYFDYFHLADIGWKIGTDDSQTGIFIVHIGELNVSIHLPLNSKEKWYLGLYVLGTCRMYGGDRIVPKTYPQICRESRIDKKKVYAMVLFFIFEHDGIHFNIMMLKFISSMLDNLLYMNMHTETSAVYFLRVSNARQFAIVVYEHVYTN